MYILQYSLCIYIYMYMCVYIYYNIVCVYIYSVYIMRYIYIYSFSALFTLPSKPKTAQHASAHNCPEIPLLRWTMELVV